MAAAQLCGHRNKITVVNTRTLCGPHRYLVEQAVRWAKEGLNRETIVERLHALMDTAKSFLVPADFDYLRRGGRLSPLVSYVGKAANLTPIMTQTDNGERLTVAGIRRGFPHAAKYIVEQLKKSRRGKGLAGPDLPRRRFGQGRAGFEGAERGYARCGVSHLSPEPRLHHPGWSRLRGSAVY